MQPSIAIPDQYRLAARFPLAETTAAHEAVESGQAIGNVVVEID